MKRPVVAIVQARMGASRLPNKMMLWLHGLPVVGWVWQRLRQAKSLDRILFALPDSPADDVLARYLQGENADVFRGSETDVLLRYTEAASFSEAGTVVRVCADNPFVTASEVDRLVEFFAEGKYDYAYNHIPRENHYPDGLGAEITHRDIIDLMHREAVEPEHREHVFNYLWANAGRFRIGTFDPLDKGMWHPELRLDLDTAEHYARLLGLRVSPASTAREVVDLVLAARRQENP